MRQTDCAAFFIGNLFIFEASTRCYVIFGKNVFGGASLIPAFLI